MSDLETGKEKLKKICEVLRNEALEPAKDEADKLVEEAKAESKRIIEEAKREAKRIVALAETEVQRKNKLFESSLSSSAKQALLALRQEIEKRLFNDELVEWVDKETLSEETSAKFINAIVEAIRKEGLSTDLSVFVASSLKAEKVNALLAKEVLEKLKEKSVVLSALGSGIQVKLHDRKITLDLSDRALAELLSKFLRKDFQTHLFAQFQ